MSKSIQNSDSEIISPLSSARRTLIKEQQGLEQINVALDGPFGEAFVRAVDLIAEARGRVILSGVGKSGHIGRKIAATMASTGTPAQFIHATEASHGDLGMVTTQDIIIVLSHSGETSELKDLLMYSRRFNVSLIAITSNADSTLATTADVALCMPKAAEACPRGLAPTTSTTMQLAIGDALAIALLEAKGFSAHDFHQFHPGGKLGAALSHADEIMHKGDALPVVGVDTIMSDTLIVISEKSFGCVGVVSDDGDLVGIVTDGDLRRHMGPDLVSKTVGDVMSANPKTVDRQTLASVALEIINAKKITSLFVVEDGKPVGILHIHDLLRIGVK
ncbi:MAG TPA: KpsF/GutQ family sugar-phosphate isomerase [Rhizobiales bacterium]|nr:KpsF/GutQ family sugar-phosphate isomerase [Hyphomicrobiales bacterium]